MSPLVVVLDFDKTLVDLLNREGYRFLIELMLQDVQHRNPSLADRFKEITPKPIEVKYPDQIETMISKFELALFSMRVRSPDLEIFVYSSCDYPYVTTIVEHLEREYSFRFARPILTNTYRVLNRSRFDNYYGKSIFQRIPDILTALKEKYPSLDTKDLLTNKILFVDNYRVVWDNIIPNAPPLQYGAESVNGVPEDLDYIPLVKEMRNKPALPVDTSILSLDYMTYLYKFYTETESSITHTDFFLNLKGIVTSAVNRKVPGFVYSHVERMNRRKI